MNPRAYEGAGQEEENEENEDEFVGVVRFNQLPRPVRKFLAELRAEDVGLLAESINFMRSAKTMGKFMKYMILTAVGAFLGAAALGDAISKIFDWFRSPPVGGS